MTAQKKRVMLIYPTGRIYQRGEDRAQSNISDSAASSVHACNDLGYAAAVLLQKGYDVFLRDYQTERCGEAEAARDIQSFRPDLVLLSVTNATVFEDLAFVERMRPFCGEACAFVLKGAIFFGAAEAHLELLPLDHIAALIGGEIDFVIGGLCDALLLGQGALRDVPGIWYREGDTFRATDFSARCTDLDSVPFPARHLMRNDLYTRPDTGEPMATVQISRGCPAGCIYCLTPIISGKAVRFRSVENVFAEIEECFYIYHIRNFFFKADTFTIDPDWVEALCARILSSPLRGKIAFTANARTRPLTERVLQNMRQAGCFMIAVGFETGSERTMARIGKGASVDDSRRAVRLIRQAGIPLFGFFMIGFPWETMEDMRRTTDLIFELQPDFIELHIAMPYYGTQLYEECRKAGTIRESAYGSDYFFTNTSGTASVPMDRIRRLKQQTLLRFYTRPAYLLRRAGDAARQPVVLKNYAKYGLRLVRNTLGGKRRG